MGPELVALDREFDPKAVGRQDVPQALSQGCEQLVSVQVPRYRPVDFEERRLLISEPAEFLVGRAMLNSHRDGGCDLLEQNRRDSGPGIRLLCHKAQRADAAPLGQERDDGDRLHAPPPQPLIADRKAVSNMLCAVQDEWAPVLDHPARDRASASNRLAQIEFEAQLAVGGVDRQCRRVGTRQQEDHAARRYHFLEHIRDRREQRLAVEMTSDGAVNFEERRELIGPQVRRPLGSRLKLVGGLLDGASLRSPTQRRVSTRVDREITKHAACTYRQVPWVPSRLGRAVARPFGTPPIPRGHVTVNSPPLEASSWRAASAGVSWRR